MLNIDELREIGATMDELNELLDQLEVAEKENAKLREALAEKVTSETMLRDLSAGNGSINAAFEGGAVHLLVDSLAGQFSESGAENYLEMHFHSDATGPLVATVQRLNGKTPHQLRAEAEKERDALRAKIAEMEKQEPVAEWTENRFHRYPQLDWADGYRAVIGEKLYALPGAQAQPAPVENTKSVRKAWVRFSNELHRSPDAPYPGMSESFERHFSQSFTDREWRAESGTWAAAWKAAKRHGAQSTPIVPDDWLPIPERHPTFDHVDLKMEDGSVLCGCVPQSDGDYWWEGPGGEVFIDPRYAPITHWRLSATPEAKP